MINTKIRLIVFFAAKMEKLYTVRKKQDREQNVAQIMNSSKFRLKLNKLRKTTRPFRYDLNHIPYDYTMK